jgi:hypothetical protein
VQLKQADLWFIGCLPTGGVLRALFGKAKKWSMLGEDQWCSIVHVVRDSL